LFLKYAQKQLGVRHFSRLRSGPYAGGHVFDLVGVNTPGVPLDKSEGAVKDKDILYSAAAPLLLPERLRTKALEISR
jgi:hypothetical protein